MRWSGMGSECTLYPVLAVLAVPLGLLALALWVVRRRNQRYPVPWMVSGRRLTGFMQVIPGVLASGALAAALVAEARPRMPVASPRTASGVDIAIALDISGSMAALDFSPGDRLTVAKSVVREFINKRVNDRIAIVVFAGAAATVCPLTLDHATAARLLDGVRIGMLPDGTAIGMGLGTCLARLKGSKAKSKVVVLVTDGANNAGEVDPLTAAKLAKDQGVVVHTVLVGEGGKVPVPVVVQDPVTGRRYKRIQRMVVETNPELLKKIADETGGKSFSAKDPEALKEVFSVIDRLERTRFKVSGTVRYRELYWPWALLTSALLALAVLFEAGLGRWAW